MASGIEDRFSFDTVQAVTCTSSPQEKYYIYSLVAVNILLVLAASLGNALILAALPKVSSLHPPTKLMFQCLTVTDLGVGVIAQPVFIIHLISTVHERMQLCYTVVAINEVVAGILLGVSLVTLTAISIDRLLALSLGLQYRHKVTLQRVQAMLIFVWFLNISLSIVRMFWNYFVISTVISAAIFSSLSISAFSYAKIFLTLRRRNAMQEDIVRQEQPNSEEGMNRPLNIARYRKTVSTALYVQLSMIACYLPYGIISSIQYEKGYSPSINLASLLAATLGGLNSTLNPILYCWKINGVRQAVKNMVKQWFNFLSS
ncbi:beta-3 adrenergic receptor-like [Orbicella faveolata]|uniref:beta-3 adrenergic receptor-like n=1 Tax=Orbicella faveolata TaxID=48498 RepID=UPI0009E1F1C0|nr:beta-3 adrenergic receptor-like [Orbicella faveolata]